MPRAETRISEDEKQEWVNFCKAARVPEAKMLRDMILRVSAGAGIRPTENRYEAKTGKVTIRLSERERRAMLERVQLEGYGNPTRWTTAVVQAALHNEPVLTDSEVAALRESNRELAAIGRNLNQVARVLNIEFRDSDKLKLDSIEKLAERIEQHKDEVAGLLFRNMNRWDGNNG